MKHNKLKAAKIAGLDFFGMNSNLKIKKVMYDLRYTGFILTVTFHKLNQLVNSFF